MLCPPNLHVYFFLTNPLLDHFPDSFAPYYGVVDSLITQVTRLEDRISYIESSDISLISDGSEMQSPRGRKSNDVSSTQSTPQKPRTKFAANSLPNSPNVDLKKSAPKSRKADLNPMLGEIDSFLSNVKYIKRLNAVRNLEYDFNGTELDSGMKKIDVDQVNRRLKHVELNDLEKPCVKEKLWQAGDNIGSVPDHGHRMRRNMYPEATNNGKSDSDSSSDCTQTTAFEKFKYKGRDRSGMKGDNYSLGLVSLSKLWNTTDFRDLPSKFQQKLQEERLRRQHCEQAIHELQNRILELQERVAVAVQVDEAKNAAISRFHESWERAGSKLQDIEKQKQRLEEEVDQLRKKLHQDCDETNHKIAHYEKEASLALNIAHGSQDKLVGLERRCQQLEVELKTSETNSEEFQKKFLEEVERNKQFADVLAQKELELNEVRSVLADARKEVSESRKAVDACQSEMPRLKSENEKLQSRLDAEQENVRKASDQKNKLLEEINAHKSISKGLQEELTKAREQIETNKVELKGFYQGQVELVVQNKLKEFQTQLDDAEKALKMELSRKELSIAKTAAAHIQQISEKHSLEIKLLEEKHQEECRLYQLQVSQLRHELEEANRRIRRQHDKHIHIERHLHKFMESLKQDHVTTLDEMNSFRSKSFNNLEEILSFDVREEGKAEPDESGRMRLGETPVSSRPTGAKRKESSLQETIQMLLDKKGDDAQYRSKGKPPWK